MRVFTKQDSTDFIIDEEEDLYLLSRILKPRQLVKGISFRRFKPVDAVNESGDKKKINVTIDVQTVELSSDNKGLRLLGTIDSGEPAEYCPKGAFHTIEIAVHDRITLLQALNEKDKLKITDFLKRKNRKILIVLMEDNIARFFEWNGRNYKEKAVVENTASKRNVKEFEKREKEFYEQIKKIIENSQKEKTVISGPGFWAKNFYDKYYKGKALYLPSSSSEKSAVRELIQSKEFTQLLKQEKEARDYEKFNEFLKHLGKEDKMICYGLKEIKEYADKNNLETVLVLENVLENMKEDLLQKLSSQCELSIILEDSDLGRDLNSFKIIGLKKYADR